MGDVISIKPCCNMPETLRSIASQIENGQIECESVTVIAGTNIMHSGTIDDSRAAVEAVWNMQYGIAKLMRMATSVEIDA